MSATSISALLPQLGEITAPAAERWIAAALAVSRALHEHDGWLYPSDPARLPAAEQLHEVWRGWAEDAEALLRQSHDLSSGGTQSIGLLRDEVARIRSMLGLSPKMIQERHQQALRGEVRPLEEVRRELRAGYRG